MYYYCTGACTARRMALMFRLWYWAHWSQLIFLPFSLTQLSRQYIEAEDSKRRTGHDAEIELYGLFVRSYAYSIVQCNVMSVTYFAAISTVLLHARGLPVLPGSPGVERLLGFGRYFHVSISTA
jgi:hypothetical protein